MSRFQTRMFFIGEDDQWLVEKDHLTFGGFNFVAEPVLFTIPIVPVKPFGQIQFFHVYIIDIYVYVGNPILLFLIQFWHFPGQIVDFGISGIKVFV